ncbi:MAG: hypothetical protein WDN04_13355 [Rhodospirillales bacterium]
MQDPTHGRVRIEPDDPEGRIGITLCGTQHCLSIEQALGLANAIIYTCVDHKERNAFIGEGWPSPV